MIAAGMFFCLHITSKSRRMKTLLRIVLPGTPHVWSSATICAKTFPSLVDKALANILQSMFSNEIGRQLDSKARSPF